MSFPSSQLHPELQARLRQGQKQVAKQMALWITIVIFVGLLGLGVLMLANSPQLLSQLKGAIGALANAAVHAQAYVSERLIHVGALVILSLYGLLKGSLASSATEVLDKAGGELRTAEAASYLAYRAHQVYRAELALNGVLVLCLWVGAMLLLAAATLDSLSWWYPNPTLTVISLVVFVLSALLSLYLGTVRMDCQRLANEIMDYLQEVREAETARQQIHERHGKRERSCD